MASTYAKETEARVSAAVDSLRKLNSRYDLPGSAHAILFDTEKLLHDLLYALVGNSDDEIADNDRIAYWQGVAERALSRQREIYAEFDAMRDRALAAERRAEGLRKAGAAFADQVEVLLSADPDMPTAQGDYTDTDKSLETFRDALSQTEGR